MTIETFRSSQPPRIDVNINGRKTTLPRLADVPLVVEAARGNFNQFQIYTITYFRGKDGAQGSMVYGDVLEVVPGMYFDVGITNNA